MTSLFEVSDSQLWEGPIIQIQQFKNYIHGAEILHLP